MPTNCESVACNKLCPHAMQRQNLLKNMQCLQQTHAQHKREYFIYEKKTKQKRRKKKRRRKIWNEKVFNKMHCQTSPHFDSSNMKIKGSNSSSNLSSHSSMCSSNSSSRDNRYKERRHFNSRAQQSDAKGQQRRPLCVDKYHGVRPL